MTTSEKQRTIQRYNKEGKLVELLEELTIEGNTVIESRAKNLWDELKRNSGEIIALNRLISMVLLCTTHRRKPEPWSAMIRKGKTSAAGMFSNEKERHDNIK